MFSPFVLYIQNTLETMKCEVLTMNCEVRIMNYEGLTVKYDM